MNLIKSTITDVAFIGNLIPQKEPFVMVDSLFYFSENKIISGFTITPNNLFAKNNYFHEAGLIENMAQTIALHKGFTNFQKKLSTPVGYIGAIKKTEIFKLPQINKTLITTVTIMHEIMDVTLVSATVECDGDLIANAEIKTALAK
ncbi:hypothetical protein GH721_09720 [Kriegella sp. EG-1]|nr:hypothetical protein [Flavobacteriaceae bacterium EG-1]